MTANKVQRWEMASELPEPYSRYVPIKEPSAEPEEAGMQTSEDLNQRGRDLENASSEELEQAKSQKGNIIAWSGELLKPCLQDRHFAATQTSSSPCRF
jgi:hypothetical protein